MSGDDNPYEIHIPGVLIDDTDAHGARVLWVLYEALEALDAYRAGLFAREYGATVTESASYMVTPRSVEALLAVSKQLDAFSPGGYFFGVDPLDPNQIGWWPESELVNAGD